jgi:hypothetical protein
MSKKRRMALALVLLAVGLALSVTTAAMSAQMPDHAPVIIKLQDEPGGIAPEETEAKRGQTLVFINNGTGPVKLKFITKIGLACAAPVNFYADLLGYYESGMIAEKGTASICLIEAGVYEFEVRRLKVVAEDQGEPTEIIARGKITVKK